MIKKHKILKKTMNCSFEEKHRFTHVSGELLIPKLLQDECLVTVICLLDKEKDYRYGIRAAGKYLCENGYRVYCSEFDEIKQEILFEKKVRCIGEIIYRIKKSKYTKEVVLLGVGKGAAYAEVLSSKMPETIRTMILYSPEFTDELYGDEFQEECYQEDKMYYVSKFKGPVLIIQGEKDKVAEMKTSEKLLNCYDNAQLNVLPGRLDEGPFWIRKRAADLSSEFIKKQLKL